MSPTPPTDPAVLYATEHDDRVAIITFNRPDNRNSMTAELLDAFEAALARARANEAMRALVITGTGSCFSGGADFKAKLPRGGGGGRVRLPHETTYAIYQPFLDVLDVEVPVIAALNGHAVGGGFGLALLCDLRIANRDARYGANFARIGLHPGLAISYLLPRLVGVSRAAELLFTGRVFPGAEALEMGLVSQAVVGDEVLPAALRVAEQIARNAPIALRLMKQTFYRGLGWDVRAAALAEAYPQAATLATHDFAEGVRALLEKRDPDFQGE